MAHLGERLIKPRVPMQDQDGRFIADIPASEAAQFIRQGYAIAHGSKTKIRSVRLVVPLAVANGDAELIDVSGRPATIHDYTGTKYTFREHIGGCFVSVRRRPS